jgi:hypothetical protein
MRVQSRPCFAMEYLFATDETWKTAGTGRS